MSGNNNGNNSNGNKSNKPRYHHHHHVMQWERQSEWLELLRSHKKVLESQGVRGWDLLEAMTTLSLNHKIAALSPHRCSQCWHDRGGSNSNSNNGNNSHCICHRLTPLVMESLLLVEEEEGKDDSSSSSSPPPPLPPPLSSSKSRQPLDCTVKIWILMHNKEYLCAGNSAKLLLQLLPNHTELFIFGKTGEVDRLYREIHPHTTTTATTNNNHDQNQNKTTTTTTTTNTMILWPGKTALSVSEFLDRLASVHPTTTTTDSNHDGTNQKTTTTATPIVIRVIVLDGTYTQARNMHKSLQKRWGQERLPVAVALRPTFASVFHRAQKNYGQAHQQQQQQHKQQRQQQFQNNNNHNNMGVDDVNDVVQRISTAEACGLLLNELHLLCRRRQQLLRPPVVEGGGVVVVVGAGGNEPLSIVQENIRRAVLINNDALAYARGRKKREEEEG